MNNNMDNTNNINNTSNNTSNNPGYNELGIPIPIKGELIYKYYSRLDKFLYSEHSTKRNKIFEFINKWMNYKYKEKEQYFEKIFYLKNIPLYKFPSNDKSKEFLIKYFNEYNEYFNLDLEYEEEKFTTYNVLYMIKLMLKTIKGDLKREIEERNIDSKIVKCKFYTVKVK
jgi:hypothetical protein